MSDTTETTFDMNAHFESIPTDPKKVEIMAALYAIDGICRKNWKTMPDDVQNEIMDVVEKALVVARSL
jgi:hypothetical protein